VPNPFPIAIIDEDGTTRLVGEADFTDPANQPGSNPANGAQLLAAFNQEDAFNFSPRLSASVPLDGVAQTGALADALTGIPVTAGMGAICVNGMSCGIFGLPDSSDSFDLDADLFVTNLAGTQVISVVVNGSTTPGDADLLLDWSTATPTALIGADLVWDGTLFAITTTAGGIFVASMLVNARWD
jgi:hypothetical protein